MKHYIKGMALAALMVLLLASCRKESGTVRNFSYMDEITWSGAKESYGEKFKILWEGLNSNYAIWDYEKEQGLDWDAVYDKYYPKFVQLDALAKNRVVTDDELEALLREVVGPLHDGHLYVKLVNHMTENTVMVNPGEDRVWKERKKDMEEIFLDNAPFQPNLAYYAGLQGKLKDIRTVDATSKTQISSVADSLTGWANKVLAVTARKTILTEEELNNERMANGILADMQQLDGMDVDQMTAKINSLALKYSFLNIDGVHELDPQLLKYGIRMTYALFEGNIAYLHFDTFSIHPFLETFQTGNNGLEPYARQLAAEVAGVWTSWFEAVQTLHKAGQLGGVIIDLRGNPGGYLADYPYVLGALVPSGGLHVFDYRAKRGIGRYDYSPLIPQVMGTYGQPHVTVTEPIVVLVNARSVSMSEMTSLGTRLLDNAKLIGTRTWGGLCGLTDNASYGYSYAGHVGVEGKTPVYVYCPCMASFTRDGKLLEGVGVTPDIEVHLDKAAWNMGQGPDSQLDRAIQYITTGK